MKGSGFIDPDDLALGYMLWCINRRLERPRAEYDLEENERPYHDILTTGRISGCCVIDTGAME